MKKKNKILLSFIGSNDAGKLAGKPDGAILTALRNEKFDQVQLLWNRGRTIEITYAQIAEYLKKEIINRKLAKKVSSTELPITDVTNHNKIYTQLKDFTDKLDKSEYLNYTAAISSGTPAMQVCWILLAESGDFSESNPLRLVQVKDPKFGTSENVPVKIDTSLPRIVRLKEEVESLKKDLIPIANISISKPGLSIGDEDIDLSPVELCYFRYFAQRVIDGLGSEKFNRLTSFKCFTENIIQFHEEFFPALDTYRNEIQRSMKKEIYTDLRTFLPNVTKTNKKIRKALQNDSISNQFIIDVHGKKGAKFYGIKAPKEKIQIVK